MSLGFRFTIKDNKIKVYRNGRQISVIGGKSAQKFINEVEYMQDEEIQQKLARLTGNYKRGNERKARKHPRSGKY